MAEADAASQAAPAPAPQPPSMKTIGIIGGSTDLATAEYYRLINGYVREELGGLHTGEILVRSMDLYWSAVYVREERWDEGAAYVAQKAASLEAGGADFLICVSNTWHRMADAFMAGRSIPLLHIVDPTARAIQAAGLTTVALLGTKATMSGAYLPGEYARRFDIAVLVPDAADQTFIDDNIFGELSHSLFTEAARARYLAVVDALVARGAQGVILGCTEIPLLISQKDRPDIPFFDTLKLHAKAAATMALHG